MVADEQAAQEFLQHVVRPRRRETPRLAHNLEGIARHWVPTRVGTVAAWRVGEGPAVMLVHGFEDDNSLWSEMIDALTARSMAAVVFDLPAHGFSEGDAGLGFEGAIAMHAVAAALGPIDAAVGHSAGGGAVGLAIDEGFPAVRSVFIAPPMRGGNRWLRVAAREGVPEETALRAQEMYEASLSEHCRSWRLHEAAPEFALGLLFVHSVDDERMPFEDTVAVVERCRNARLLRVEGCSHRRTARDPVAIKGILDFLDAG